MRGVTSWVSGAYVEVVNGDKGVVDGVVVEDGLVARGDLLRNRFDLVHGHEHLGHFLLEGHEERAEHLVDLFVDGFEVRLVHEHLLRVLLDVDALQRIDDLAHVCAQVLAHQHLDAVAELLHLLQLVHVRLHEGRQLARSEQLLQGHLRVRQARQQVFVALVLEDDLLFHPAVPTVVLLELVDLAQLLAEVLHEGRVAAALHQAQRGLVFLALDFDDLVDAVEAVVERLSVLGDLEDLGHEAVLAELADGVEFVLGFFAGGACVDEVLEEWHVVGLVDVVDAVLEVEHGLLHVLLLVAHEELQRLLDRLHLFALERREELRVGRQDADVLRLQRAHLLLHRLDVRQLFAVRDARLEDLFVHELGVFESLLQRLELLLQVLLLVEGVFVHVLQHVDRFFEVRDLEADEALGLGFGVLLLHRVRDADQAVDGELVVLGEHVFEQVAEDLLERGVVLEDVFDRVEVVRDLLLQTREVVVGDLAGLGHDVEDAVVGQSDHQRVEELERACAELDRQLHGVLERLVVAHEFLRGPNRLGESVVRTGASAARVCTALRTASAGGTWRPG